MGDIFDGLGDLGDVLFDEILGAGEGAVVEGRGGDVAEVANQAGAEEVDEGIKVAILSRGDQGVEAFVDESVIVVLGRRVVPPVAARQTLACAPETR